MNRLTRMTIIVLSVFVLGIVMTAIAAGPVDAKKFKDNGYEWEINGADWEKIIKVANDGIEVRKVREGQFRLDTPIRKTLP